MRTQPTIKEAPARHEVTFDDKIAKISQRKVPVRLGNELDHKEKESLALLEDIIGFAY